MTETTGGRPSGPRCIALVGPYQSGKTTLLEAILHRTGAISRMGSVKEGNTVGDASAAARAHGMSVEVNVASTEFLGDTYTFIDCPGSVEFAEDARAALVACDAAVVVMEPDPKKVPALQLILKQLDEIGLPRLIFINKIDKAEGGVRDMLAWLQPASSQPLVLRQIPIWKNGIAIGTVDLALERAYIYREHAPSEVVEIPAEEKDREAEARFEMLEKLADYDDELLETLLSDMEPPTDKIFEDLHKELAEGLITPVLLGSAENENGILRLMKALRHDVDGIERTAARLGVDPEAKGVGWVMKTFYLQQGKMSLVRVLAGSLSDGDTVHASGGNSARIGGLFTLFGQEARKISGPARAGDAIALGRLEGIGTGEAISLDKAELPDIAVPPGPQPVYGMALTVSDRKDEVKLTGALAKLMEEDPALVLKHDPDTGEMVLWGQGEMHLRVALEKLKEKFGVSAEAHPRRIAYKETIRKPARARGRHKKQTGGHGQYGDVILSIRPLGRGEGFAFSDTITGGVVPKQYIPAVEAGVKEYNERGPLGFPVVDIAVTLEDGSYHTVDSSELAFKLAARLAMSEAMKEASPVLLEPIVHVKIHVPSEATSKVTQIVSAHRGQILGFAPREGWTGWDTVEAHMPEAEIADLIVELRSATAGVGTFEFAFDHMQELTGKLAEDVIRRFGAGAGEG
ncbi:elongation factor G [Thermopetrobacter sp. TC1]|uniref:elongation factor G n=1 Tax=Thermopetrobacter sp. TC1 TaxID=1495045 RepID=UPI00056F431F|nr:elongation factor G [Thermopetrobacter sp. TC1]